LAALKTQNSLLAYCAAFYTFIVAGLPVGSLFLAKFTVFFEASQQLDFSLLILFIFFSTFAFVYYIRLVRLLLFSDKNSFYILFQPIPQITAYLLGFGIYLNLLMFVLYDKFILLAVSLTL
jgi:NADH:ubiquinone oxidoreductase subunit 2 (subunit N)